MTERDIFVTIFSVVVAGTLFLYYWRQAAKRLKDESLKNESAPAWKKPRVQTIAGTVMQMTQYGTQIRVDWPEVDAQATSGNHAIVAPTQTVLQALAEPRSATPTLDPQFDAAFEISGATPIEVACTFDAETRAALQKLITQTTCEFHLPLFVSAPSRWKRAIDGEPESAARLRAVLLAQRPEDPVPSADDLSEALITGLDTMDGSPVRLRRRWVQAILDATTGELQTHLTSIFAADGPTDLVQMWLATLSSSEQPVHDKDRPGLELVLEERSEPHLLEAVIELLKNKGVLADVTLLQIVSTRITRGAALREAAKDAISYLQATVPGAKAGSLALMAPETGGVSLEPIAKESGALAVDEEPV